VLLISRGLKIKTYKPQVIEQITADFIHGAGTRMCFEIWKIVKPNYKRNEQSKESITVLTYTKGDGAYCSKTSKNITAMSYIQKVLHLSAKFSSICM
jgi:hypothetical protein